MTSEPLAGRLRSETADLHRKTETIVGVPGSVQTRQQYAQLLERLAVFYSSAQRAMEDERWHSGWQLVDIDIASHSRISLLRSDLKQLGAPEPGGGQSVVPIDSFGAALGCLYVVEGSSLGGLSIGPAIRATLGSVPTSFYDGAGRGHPRAWRRVQAALAAYDLGHPDVEDVITGAELAFVRFGEIVGSSAGGLLQ